MLGLSYGDFFMIIGVTAALLGILCLFVVCNDFDIFLFVPLKLNHLYYANHLLGF